MPAQQQAPPQPEPQPEPAPEPPPPPTAERLNEGKSKGARSDQPSSPESKPPAGEPKFRVEAPPGNKEQVANELRTFAQQTSEKIQPSGGYTHPEVLSRAAVVSPSLGAAPQPGGPPQVPHQEGVQMGMTGQLGAPQFTPPAWLVPIILEVIQSILKATV